MRIFVTLVLLVSLTSAPSAQVEQRSRRIDPINVLSQGILAGALTRIDQGSPAGMDPRPTIHHNFPQLIEQNFVRMTPAAMARFLDSMSMREIADLAQLYTTATADNGRQPRLLDVMALRLDGTRLGRVSEHFGFGPVYAAIWRVAPEKSMMFQQTARTSAAAPTPGAMLASLPSSAAQIKGAIQITAGPNFLDMTIPEIYFTYRSAAMGSLSSAAAAWEASVLVGLRFSGALGYGYTAGTIINYAFSTYAPEAYNEFGGVLVVLVDFIKVNFSKPAARAEAERKGAQLLQLPDYMMSNFATEGGDYQVFSDWRDNSGGGGDPCRNCLFTEF